jgi:dTDP-4-dehydrorhamnose reductase
MNESARDPPTGIDTEEDLDELLTRPGPALVDFARTLSDPLVILGAAGKMGPTLAVLARRAAEQAGRPLEVVAVSRFSDDRARRWLDARGVRTLQADVLDRSALARLPDAGQVISLVGLKFGTSRNAAPTWAVNTLASANVVERYAGARIVALSTGNVYPLSRVADGGSVETDALTPLGEYANAAVARERIYEFLGARQRTPVCLLRLNYAVEPRYGVLVDIARKVWAGEPVDVTTGWLNCIWQPDANEMVLRSLALARVPPLPVNLTGGIVSVRELATRLGDLLGKPARITGVEADTALLSNTDRLRELLGAPPTSLDAVLRWTAHWIARGGRLLDKPTHFEVRDGKY